jgi:PRTRC genetic system protein B
MTGTLTGAPLPEEAALLFLKGQFALRYHDSSKGTAIKLLSPESVRAAISNTPVDSGWLPAAVRRWGCTQKGEYAVMFISPARHTLRLTNTWKERFPGRRYLSVDVPLPGLVFAGRGAHYYVWACTGKPAPEAPLYQAPLPNVHDDGLICYGDNHPPEAGPRSIEKAWRLFINTPFNDHLRGGPSKQYPDDVREKLLSLAEAQASAYPTDDLVRQGRHTVASAVDRLVERGVDP